MADRLSYRIAPFVQRECVVSILLPKHSHHLYVAQLAAVLKAGAAYTCIDPSFPEEYIRFIVEDSQSVVVLRPLHSRFNTYRVLTSFSAPKSAKPVFFAPEPNLTNGHAKRSSPPLFFDVYSGTFPP